MTFLTVSSARRTYRMLYFDATRGIAGDMTVAALIDLGADSGKIIKKVGRIAEVEVKKVKRAGVAATKFHVNYGHEERLLSDLRKDLKSMRLSPKAFNLAWRILSELGRAEAKAHSTSISKVHLHEAADSVVDAAATAIALEDLGLINGPFSCSIVSVGKLAPAAAEIIESNSVPIRFSSNLEVTTPTGAAIVAALKPKYDTKKPNGKTGFGAGCWDLSHPNVLTVVLADEFFMLESNIDDATPEELSYAMERLMREGALDANVTQCIMKKGRLGFLFTVLTKDPTRHAQVVMEETGTLGVRVKPVERFEAERVIREKRISVGGKSEVVRIKKSRFKAKPEFDDVARIARNHNKSFRSIRRKAL